LPGNPICWSVIAVGREGERYIARRGVISIAPALLAPRRCPSLDGVTTTAPLSPIEASDGAILWRSKFSAPLAELRALWRTHCDAAAFLRYSRVPFWNSHTEVVGDLRFDRTRALEFAEIKLSSGTDPGGRDHMKQPCPRNVPPWTPPRQDLLEGP
jgi:inner membrane protein